jgi:polar amino acid transport system substrate-binding protein
LLLAILGAACNPASSPTPSPVDTAVPIAAVCERVAASGKIVVGTSADYPPFEYYDETFALTGFDVALMNGIAADLGLQAEFKDYAFDGLLSAVQLGEVDAAIAAITVTDERQALVDFSDAYYFGRGASLVRAGSGAVNLAIPAEFAGLRVGVERGTVYQSWAEANLVAPGILPETQLFVYESAADAVRDLEEERLDVVLLDDQAARNVAAGGRLEVAAEDPVGQLYAIALPKDAECLRTEVNRGLASLAQAGVVDEIARTYIGGGVLSVPTATATLTPVATLSAPTWTPTATLCLDSSQFVIDLTYDDEGGKDPPTVQPNQEFTKGWRLRNTGTCSWNANYRLAYVGGNNKAARMDGDPENVVGSVSPGHTYDFYVDLQAPSGVLGVEQGRWQMQNSARTFFGQTVWVMVEVVAPTPTRTASSQPTATQTATGTPPPSATPSATVAPPFNSLEGNTFRFLSIGREPTIPDSVLRVTFGDNGQLIGLSGCNTYSGPYVVQPAGATQGSIQITVTNVTDQVCTSPEGIMEQEQAFLAALGQVTAYAYPPKGVLITLMDAAGLDLLTGELN